MPKRSKDKMKCVTESERFAGMKFGSERAEKSRNILLGIHVSQSMTVFQLCPSNHLAIIVRLESMRIRLIVRRFSSWNWECCWRKLGYERFPSTRWKLFGWKQSSQRDKSRHMKVLSRILSHWWPLILRILHSNTLSTQRRILPKSIIAEAEARKPEFLANLAQLDDFSAQCGLRRRDLTLAICIE
jgi:hypothetical protein